LLSIVYSHFKIERNFGFPSIPSNNSVFNRKFETQARFFGHFLAEF